MAQCRGPDVVRTTFRRRTFPPGRDPVFSLVPLPPLSTVKPLLRLLLVALTALWIAAPTTGTEGGENAGGTGVWILPACAGISKPAQPATRQLTNLGRDLTMRVQSTMGSVVATACDPASGLIVPLQVSGRNVSLPSSVICGFRDAAVKRVELLIVDSRMNGYKIRMMISQNGDSATLDVY